MGRLYCWYICMRIWRRNKTHTKKREFVLAFLAIHHTNKTNYSIQKSNDPSRVDGRKMSERLKKNSFFYYFTVVFRVEKSPTIGTQSSIWIYNFEISLHFSTNFFCIALLNSCCESFIDEITHIIYTNTWALITFFLLYISDCLLESLSQKYYFITLNSTVSSWLQFFAYLKATILAYWI